MDETPAPTPARLSLKDGPVGQFIVVAAAAVGILGALGTPIVNSMITARDGAETRQMVQTLIAEFKLMPRPSDWLAHDQAIQKLREDIGKIHDDENRDAVEIARVGTLTDQLVAGTGAMTRRHQ